MEPDLFLKEQKRELESIVIGEVILENKYILIGSILGPQNFGNYINADNRIIWKAIERMFPSIPLDLITISSKLYEWFRVDYKQTLTEYTSKVASACHIRYHAILLLELDIRMKVQTILYNQYLKEKSKGKYSIASDITEMIEHIHCPENDLFITIEGILDFVKNEDYKELHMGLNSIIDYLPEKISKIKCDSQVHSCLTHLSKLTNMQPQQELLIEKLINTIKIIYQQPNLDYDRVKNNITELLNLI